METVWSTKNILHSCDRLSVSHVPEVPQSCRDSLDSRDSLGDADSAAIMAVHTSIDMRAIAAYTF